MLGELIPHGGGDPIPLIKSELMVGRRESCDIVLRFSNISAHHCELFLEHGYWFVKDLNSRNGTKVNGLRVTGKKRLDPGDRLSIAKHNYRVEYSPTDLGAEGPPPDDTMMSDILGSSLMDSAGLNRRAKHERDGRIGAARPGETAPSESEESPPAEGESPPGAEDDQDEPGPGPDSPEVVAEDPSEDDREEKDA
jgi:adenylate cyclase